MFYIVRKLVIVLLTNYFNNMENKLLADNKNKAIYNKTIILKGTIDKEFKNKKPITNRNPNQKLCSKYNKNVYRGLNGRYLSCNANKNNNDC